MSKRIDWIDDVKFVGIVSVVYFHVIDGLHYTYNFNGWSYFIPTTFTKGIALSAFFFSSGIFAKKWLQKENKYRKKILTLLVPYFIWSIIYTVINVMLNKNVNHPTKLSAILTIPFYPQWHFWFIYYLFFCFLLFVIMQKFSLNNQIVFCFIGCLLGAFLTTKGIKLWILDNFFQYFVFFLLGSLYSKIELKVKSINIIFLLFSLICSYSLYVYMFIQNKISIVYLLSFVTSITAIIALIRLFKQCKYIPLFSFIGRRSMPIYLLHVFFTSFTRIILLKFAINSIVINISLGLVFGINLPIFVYWVTQRLKINKLLFGM